MDQAISCDIKAFDGDQRTFSGIASTARLDRQGQIVDPAGVTFPERVPLLLHHDQKQPVGWATLRREPDGIYFDAHIPPVDEPGRLKDRADEAWQLVKHGFIKTVSAGLRSAAAAVERLKNGAVKLGQTEILELSLVSIPANPDAAILRSKTVGAPAMGTAEQIVELENTRVPKLARMEAILQDDTLDDTRQKEYDALQAEVTAIDARLPRLRAFEKAMASTATPVDQLLAVRTVSTPKIQVKSNLPPGQGWVRYCKAMLAAGGNRYDAIEYAKQWRDTPDVELALKAASAPATVANVPWAGALVPGAQYLGSEFIEFIRPATLLGRIPGLNRVPFNVKVPRQTSSGLVAWVAEGAPKPVSMLAFDTVSLLEYKMAQILTFTQELARNSSPAAEDTFRRSMIAGMQQFMDAQFIDPAVALVAGKNPASITNGVTGITATSNPLVDIAALLNSFVTAGLGIGGVVLLMSEANAFVLSNRRSAMGAPDFPSVSIGGGSIAGVPVVTSQACGTNIIGLIPSMVLYADDGGVRIDVSQEASVQMVDNPAAPDATTVYRSFWQDNLIGLRAERFVAWLKAHANAVNMIVSTAYVPNLAEAPPL